MAGPNDVQRLAKQLMTGASSEESEALLDALMSGQVTPASSTDCSATRTDADPVKESSGD